MRKGEWNSRPGKPPGRGSTADRHGRRPSPRDRFRPGASPDGPAILYGIHTVKAALENPERHIRRLLTTENALRRLREDGARFPSSRKWCGPTRSRHGSARKRCIRACWRKPIPCPRPTSRTLSRTASCWCSTRSPIRTTSARFSAPPQPLRLPPSSRPRVTRRKRPACWRRPRPARSNWCRS